MYQDIQRKIFTHKRPHQGSERKYWYQISNTDAVFDELVALSKQQNACILQNTSRDTVYDIITSGEEDLLDNTYKWIPNRNKKKRTVEDWNALRKNVRNEQEKVNGTDVPLHKRKFFKTRTSQLDGGRKKNKIDYPEFGSYSTHVTSHQSSETSENSCGCLKHNKPKFHYPAIVSDVSSDEDVTLYEEKFHKRRNYQNFTTYDPEHKLANQMHRRIFQSHVLIQNNYSQRNDHIKSNSSKKHCLKSSLDKIKKNNSRSHRTTSTREENCVQTLQTNTQEQLLSVKNKVLYDGMTQTEAPQNQNQERVSSLKDNGFLPELTHVRKLEIQNQKRREIEYLRAISGDDLSTPDLNALCTYKENDAQEHLLPKISVSLTEEEKLIQNTKALLSSNEEPVIPFSPSEENSNSEISYTTSPPVINLTWSYSSPEKRKTSTPVYSQPSGINFSPSPIKSSRKLAKTSLATAHRYEMHTNSSHSLPSKAIKDIQMNKNSLRRITLRQKNNNSTEMGFPNPIGTNMCWMNSSLQALFGMKPFIEDVMNFFEKSNTLESRGKYSSILEKFIEVVKARQRRNQLQLNRNLKLLYQSLGVLNEHFTTHSQEDAVEFLTEFFSALHEEFNRLMCNNKMCATVADNCQQEQNNNNINDTKNCQQDQSNTHIQLNNPVNENIIFRLKESHSCVMCSKHNSKETEHLALIVNIPSETFKEITLQEALERCMVTETRELKCVQCESQHCRVKTMFTLLPRFLMLHVNRFEIRNNVVKKLCNYLKIPITLTVKNVISETETMMPLQWMSARHKRFSWSKDMSSCLPQLNNEGEMFQHAAQHSMDEPKAVNNKQEYTLFAIISHKGDTANSGHYEADVYNVTSRKWNHFNDEIVTSETEEEVTGFFQQENGYAFLYMYKPLFIQLVNEHMMSRNYETE